uniref:Putative secretory peptide-37 n=1 Tax=Pleurobrachia bachei TaxID=34499 RepID=M4H1D7_PLEBA|nr:putative secretory peptide-37 [Pleurobrachia bachei]|eukprot:sb/3465378/
MIIMLEIVLLAALSRAVYGVDSDIEIVPTSREWKLIPTGNEEYINFPIQDFILEVKGTKPENVDRDPLYENGGFTPKEHTKLVRLRTPYDVNKNGKGDDDLGFIAWNPVHYVKGFDVFIEFCHQNYKSYREEPCDGATEQIWSWNFQPDRVSLSCNRILEYEIVYEYGEFTTNKFGDCSLFGRKKIDKIDFRHLKGWYYRGIQKTSPFVTPPNQFSISYNRLTSPITEMPTEPVMVRRTCDCWNVECGWCTKLECAIKWRVSEDREGITVNSRLWWKRTNNIVLFNSAGVKVGEINWSRRAVFLVGCVKCRVMARVPFTPKELDDWTFSLANASLKIVTGDRLVSHHDLIGECKKAYADIAYFAFARSSCEGTVYMKEGMEVGEMLKRTNCSGSCDAA